MAPIRESPSSGPKSAVELLACEAEDARRSAGLANGAEDIVVGGAGQRSDGGLSQPVADRFPIVSDVFGC